MNQPRAPLVALVLCVTLALGLTAAATARSAVITFDDLGAPGPSGLGLAVTSQYPGATFGNASAFDYSKGPSAIPGFARSPHVAVEPCAGIELCTAPLSAGFGTPQTHVKAWVGFSYPLPQPLGVRLTAFNDSTAVGTAEATLAASPGPTPVGTPLEVTGAGAVITRFEVSVTTGGGYTSGLAVDDVEFSTVGPPPACAASGPPTVTLPQPADGSSVYTDAFLLAGSVQANGAPVTSVAVTTRSAAGDRVLQLLPRLISTSGGAFGPTSFGGLLTLGANTVTVSATNCAGTGTSAARTVTLRPRPAAKACTPDPRYLGVYVADENDIAGLVRTLESGFRGQVIFPLGGTWDLSGISAIPLRPGVSLVGERGPLGERPLIRTRDLPWPNRLFEIEGPGVCIEGLHIEGPSRSKAKLPKTTPTYKGLYVTEDPCEFHGTAGCTCSSPLTGEAEPCDASSPADSVVIADNELAGWTGGAVAPTGTVQFPDRKLPRGYDGPRMRPEDARRVRIERNYIHHNARESFGYGVVIGGSAYATVYGNTFDFNRHSVTSEGQPFSGYVVRFNYMLENAYTYGNRAYTPHLDVHGTGNKAHYGGIAGEYHLVERNTIRGEQEYDCILGHRCETRAALVLRGRSTKGFLFRRNILVQDDFGEAFGLEPGDDSSLIPSMPRTFGFEQRDNEFDTDHSSELVAGDFDGDGRTDVLVANGTSWMLSRAGVRPWEFLRPATALRRDLGFADIDNDGATDVLFRNGRTELGYYSRGASASITPLTKSPVPARDLRFGDFDGDGTTDIFLTRNGQWRIWHGGTRAWANAARSKAPLANLLFGDFDDLPGTDVATVVGNQWSVSSGATARWARLNGRLRPSFGGAVAADFDGNGRTDIAFDDGGTWRFSPDGRGRLQLLRRKQGAVGPLNRLMLGRFQGGARTTVVSFDPRNRNQFAIWRGLGSDARFVRLSQQGMR